MASNIIFMEKRDLLYFCTFCRDKSEEEIENLKCSIPHSVSKYKRGEYVAYQGDRVSSLEMLVKGKVRTEIVSSSGLALSMGEIAAPSPLAAAFLFADDNKFPVDVIALEESEVVFISKESVEAQMAKCPGFLRGFMAFNANRMQYISERLKVFAQKGIKGKIAYYLMQREKNGEFELGQSVSSLAQYFGVERPSLSRALSEMADDGIISFDSGRGKILDNEKLQALL